MAINGLNAGTGVTTNQSAGVYSSVNVTKETTKVSVTLSSSDAAVYSKSEEAKVNEEAEKKNQEKTATELKAKDTRVDPKTIERLKAEADERNAQLKGLVEKMLLKQAGTVSNSEGLANIYRRLEVDDETRAQAQKDIEEDGYWGVEQTSDRIVDFAKALAGTSYKLAEEMLEAVKEGFKQAEKAWGEELPELSKKTMDATFDKLNKWMDELKSGAGLSGQSITIEASYSKTTVNAQTTIITDEPDVNIADKAVEQIEK